MHSPFFAECFRPHPGSNGIDWQLFSSRFTQTLDTCFKICKRLDIPKSTTDLESSVPQNQLFYCPFMLGKTGKTHLIACCIKTAKKSKITFKRSVPFTRPQGQLFCIVLSRSFCFRFLLPLRLSHTHTHTFTPSFNMKTPRGVLCVSLHGLYFYYILTRWRIPWVEWSGKKKWRQEIFSGYYWLTVFRNRGNHFWLV